jgi:hypothetical protein
MELLVPKEEVAARFSCPVLFEDLSLDQFQEIERRKGSSLYELGLTVWTHHLEIEPRTDPRALAEYVDSEDPQLLARISREIDREVLFDIQYTIGRVQDEQLDYNVVAEVLAAFVYPGYLHISDVEFSNPYVPIPPNERKYQLQKFAGLGIFGTLMDQTVEVARKIGASHISLTAAVPDLVPFFARFGFEVEDNAAGEYGLANGLSVPMRQRL